MKKPTKAQIKEAIRESSVKWRRLADGENIGWDADTCSLCALFINRKDESGNVCHGCPVKRVTGYERCVGTPWKEYNSSRYTGRAKDEEPRLIAFRMHLFLNGLKP